MVGALVGHRDPPGVRHEGGRAAERVAADEDRAATGGEGRDADRSPRGRHLRLEQLGGVLVEVRVDERVGIEGSVVSSGHREAEIFRRGSGENPRGEARGNRERHTASAAGDERAVDAEIHGRRERLLRRVGRALLGLDVGSKPVRDPLDDGLNVPVADRAVALEHRVRLLGGDAEPSGGFDGRSISEGHARGVVEFHRGLDGDGGDGTAGPGVHLGLEVQPSRRGGGGVLTGRDPDVRARGKINLVSEEQLFIDGRGGGRAELGLSIKPCGPAGDGVGDIENRGRSNRQIARGREGGIVFYLDHRADGGGGLGIHRGNGNCRATPGPDAVGNPDIARRENRNTARDAVARLDDPRPGADQHFRGSGHGVDAAGNPLALGCFADELPPAAAGGEDASARHPRGKVGSGAVDEIVARQNDRSGGVDVCRGMDGRFSRGCGREGGGGNAHPE